MRTGRNIERRRTVVAWLLLLALVPFFLVKAFHTHEEPGCCHSQTERHAPASGDAEECAICQFALSAFIETGMPHCDVLQVESPMIYLTCAEKYVCLSLCIPLLRAPPTLVS